MSQCLLRTPISANALVSEIAITYPATIPTFARLGIGYCCDGRVPLGDACRERSLSVDAVVRELRLITPAGSPEAASAWHTRPLGSLVEHIVLDYHEPLRRDLAIADQLLTKVESRHGASYPAMLGPVRVAFDRLRLVLLSHMEGEDSVWFPHIRRLLDGTRCGDLDARRLLPQLTREHLKATALVNELRGLTGGYTAPPGACPTFRALFSALAGLERELERHTALEDRVLFPRAAALEAELELASGPGMKGTPVVTDRRGGSSGGR